MEDMYIEDMSCYIYASLLYDTLDLRVWNRAMHTVQHAFALGGRTV